MHRSLVTLGAAILVALATQAAAVETRQESRTRQSVDQHNPNESDLVPDGKGRGVRAAPGMARPTPGSGSNGIYYNGGPVIAGGVNVYTIWYGNWSGNTAPSIIADFLNNLGGSPYFNINTTYSTSTSKITNAVIPSGTTSVAYPYGTALSDAQIKQVVADAISAGKVVKDPKGVYFVLTSSDVTASSGFCTKYCGWHTRASIAGTDIKYSFVGNPDRCPASCSMQTSPNGNPGADGMASIIAHELEEAVTDPDLNAWYDRQGAENADKCAWTFGSTYTTANGATANMNLGGRDFLIQQNWVNAAGGYCALAY